MNEKLNICILGLSITSSWGNGHATTFRSIVKGLWQRGHKVSFLERDKPWYASQRDLLASPYCDIHLYSSVEELKEKYKLMVESVDCVIVGSYVPDGIAVGQWVQQIAKGTVAFYDIDTPITLAKLENNDCDYLSKDLIPGYDLYLSFTGGPVLKFIERELGSPKAKPFYCLFDPELYFPQTVSAKWDMGYMGTYSDDRQPTLNNLLIETAQLRPDKRFVVAGPQYPPHIKWPCNVFRIDHLPPDQHREFYNSQKFTLNITRSDMIKSGYSPSVRLFEAAGCATPIISDYWEGLETFFVPDEEILIASNAREVDLILNKMTETERKNIASKAYVKALSNHTPTHRAMELEKYLQEIESTQQIKEKQYQSEDGR